MTPTPTDTTASRAVALLVRWLKPSSARVVGPAPTVWREAFAQAGVAHDEDACADVVVALGPPDDEPARYVAKLLRLGRRVVIADTTLWPAEWADLFTRHSYRTDDRLRQRLWHAADTDGQVVQGLLLFEPATELGRRPRPAAYVHPHTHRALTDPDHVPTTRLLRLLGCQLQRSANRLARRASRLLAGRL